MSEHDSQPWVIASYQGADRTWLLGSKTSSPLVQIEVGFSLLDSTEALAALDRAVAEVREQIEAVQQ